MTINNNDWGVVQVLRIEADTKTALKAGLEIAMTYNSVIRAFKKIVDDTGTMALVLYNSVHSDTAEFLAPIRKVDDACQQVYAWLNSADVTPASNPYVDGDGSSVEGFSLFVPDCDYILRNGAVITNEHSIVCIIQPTFIYYSK